MNVLQPRDYQKAGVTAIAAQQLFGSGVKLRPGQTVEYVITDRGVVIIHPRRTDYEGLTTGIPRRTGPRKAQENEAAPEPKARK